MLKFFFTKFAIKQQKITAKQHIPVVIQHTVVGLPLGPNFFFYTFDSLHERCLNVLSCQTEFERKHQQVFMG